MSSAHEGLDFLQATPVATVVSDFEMPKMDDLQFAAIIRKSYPALPVFIHPGSQSFMSGRECPAEKLKSHPEPEARFMRTASGPVPAYNVQTAVDAEHALIVAQQVTTETNDQRSLLPMAEAAKQAVGAPALLNVVADAGYSNGEPVPVRREHGYIPLSGRAKARA